MWIEIKFIICLVIDIGSVGNLKLRIGLFDVL